jgi:hypothetical protein
MSSVGVGTAFTAARSRLKRTTGLNIVVEMGGELVGWSGL